MTLYVLYCFVDLILFLCVNIIAEITERVNKHTCECNSFFVCLFIYLRFCSFIFSLHRIENEFWIKIYSCQFFALSFLFCSFVSPPHRCSSIFFSAKFWLLLILLCAIFLLFKCILMSEAVSKSCLPTSANGS